MSFSGDDMNSQINVPKFFGTIFCLKNCIDCCTTALLQSDVNKTRTTEKIEKWIEI